jgi:hypothetical protein
MPPQTPSEPLQIGVGRAVPQAADAKAMAGLLSWSAAANGSRRAAISVRSPGAAALRFGLLVEQLPQSALLRVYAPGAAQAEEVTGTEVLSALQRLLNAGESGEQAHTYWLPSVEGDQAVLEIELPAGVDPMSLRVSLPGISHRYASEDLRRRMYHGEAASCHVNAMCSVAKDSSNVKAVAWMTFRKSDGKWYGCSGTLLNDKKSDYIPYILTANHCIPDKTVASTVEVAWNYHTVSCKDSTIDPTSTSQTGGAEWLYSSGVNDGSFIRLNFQPPRGLTYAGWDARTPNTLPSNMEVYSLHYPKGDTQKYSSGMVDQYASYVNFALCPLLTKFCDDKTSFEPLSKYPFYYVRWSEGSTEEGSSGGPLFSSNGQVIGAAYSTLLPSVDGGERCIGPNHDQPNKGLRVLFSRFDLVYQDGQLWKWLN